MKRDLHELPESRANAASVPALQDENRRLKHELAEPKRKLGAHIGEMHEHIRVVEGEVKKQETRAGSFVQKWEKARAELKERKPEQEVLYAFCKSDTYAQELATASAEKIHQCWLIAKKHIRSDAKTSWEKFCALFMEAEEAVEKADAAKQVENLGVQTLLKPRCLDSKIFIHGCVRFWVYAHVIESMLTFVNSNLFPYFECMNVFLFPSLFLFGVMYAPGLLFIVYSEKIKNIFQ